MTLVDLPSNDFETHQFRIAFVQIVVGVADQRGGSWLLILFLLLLVLVLVLRIAAVPLAVLKVDG